MALSPPSPRPVLAILAAILGTTLASAAKAEDALPRKTLEDLKAATVFLKVEQGGESGSGSGFVIKTDGQTAYLVTNHHVTDMSEGKPGRGGAPTITAVFGSGTRQEQTARAEIVASDPRRDVAILRVNVVRDLPPPIDHEHEPELIETMPVYILGFPLGEILATGKGNPAITVNKGTVSSIRLNDKGEVATVQINGDITPGNSGGPVVDVRGRLVGIATATIRGRTIGFAVPATALNKRLQGHILDYHFTSRSTGGGKVDVQVELSVFDPFERIKGISFYYLPEDRPPANKLAGMADVRKAELRRMPRQVGGSFTLDAAGPIAFQVVYVNGQDKTILSNPRVRRFR